MDGDPYWIYTWEITAVFLTKGASHPAFLRAPPLRVVMHKTGGAPEDVLNGRYPSSIWCEGEWVCCNKKKKKKESLCDLAVGFYDQI